MINKIYVKRILFLLISCLLSPVYCSDRLKELNKRMEAGKKNQVAQISYAQATFLVKYDHASTVHTQLLNPNNVTIPADMKTKMDIENEKIALVEKAIGNKSKSDQTYQVDAQGKVKVYCESSTHQKQHKSCKSCH